MAHHYADDGIQQLDYIRNLRPAKWGSVVSLHGGNPEPLMSALGQKRTSPHVRAMSALPPKADIVGRNSDVRFVPKADIHRFDRLVGGRRLGRRR